MVTSKTIIASAPRIPELDGLRGIAILLVVSFHYINNQLVGHSNPFAKIAAKLTSFGWVGVDLFFVLSGFLIGSILIKNKKTTNFFSTFYIRRLVRIVPNYYLLILLFLLLVSIPFFSGSYFVTGNNNIPWWSYFLMVHNFYMAFLDNMGNPAMSVTWSIGIEEQFYIIFPFIVFYAKDTWLPYILLLAIIVASLLRLQYSSWISPYVLLPCRMDAISFGALIAWVNCRFDLKVLVYSWQKLLWIILFTDVIISFFLYYNFGDLGVIKHFLFAIFFSVCLVYALTFTNSWYSVFLRNSILRWVGSISYSLYLFHYLFLGVFHRIFSGSGFIGIVNLKDVFVSLFALAFSLLFSRVIYQKLETPMVNFGKKFKY